MNPRQEWIPPPSPPLDLLTKKTSADGRILHGLGDEEYDRGDAGAALATTVDLTVVSLASVMDHCWDFLLHVIDQRPIASYAAGSVRIPCRSASVAIES